MLGVSSWIGMRSTKKNSWQTYRKILVSIGIAGSLNLALVMFFILHLYPWYQLRGMIPIAGMIYSTGMNVVSLCAERYESEMERSDNHELSRRDSYRAALIPQVNSFLAVGLVMGMIMSTAGLAAALYLFMAVASAELARMDLKSVYHGGSCPVGFMADALMH